MHVFFMTHGIIDAVEHTKIDMQAQKFRLRMYKEGQPDKYIWMQGRLSIGPFGIWDYSFPKEDLDIVLTTLDGAQNGYKHKISDFKVNVLRKLLHLEKIPKEFKKDMKLIWIIVNVGFVPIGISRDGEFTEPSGEWAGWTHEGI